MSGKGQQKRKASRPEVDKENVADDPGPSKKLRLSLRKGKDPVQPGQRFGEVTDEELAALSKGHVPVNTEKCTVWAVGIYRHGVRVVVNAEVGFRTYSKSLMIMTVSPIACLYSSRKPGNRMARNIHPRACTRFCVVSCATCGKTIPLAPIF